MGHKTLSKGHGLSVEQEYQGVSMIGGGVISTYSSFICGGGGGFLSKAIGQGLL